MLVAFYPVAFCLGHCVRTPYIGLHAAQLISARVLKFVAVSLSISAYSKCQ